MLGLIVQAVVSPLLLITKLLGFIQWSWGYIVIVPIALALATVLLGLFEHLSAHATFTVERKRPPRHIL